MINFAEYSLTDYEKISLQQDQNNFILSIIVAAITFVSVVLIYIDYRNRKNKERAEKSIEIAKEFALEIISPLSILYAFFTAYNIDKIINKINFIQLEDFDLEELHSLYNDSDINKYQKLIQENDSKHKIRDLICDTLNKLEYMCMYISTNVADEKYIYNSLHQQFLKVIALLYLEISSTNINSKDKYYTNIIHVYNLWKNKYIKASKKEDAFKKKQKQKKKKLLPSPKI